MKRRPVKVVRDTLAAVNKSIANHDYRGAKNRLNRVEPEVQRLRHFWNVGDIGDYYDRLAERLRVESAIPCDCWCCGFTEEQKQMVIELTKEKAADFDCEFPDRQNNLTGAYAEVVFGVKFHKPIKPRGPDGGIDFCFPCEQMPSGILTVDVKGTIYDQFRLPAVPRLSGDGARNTRYEDNFIRPADRSEEGFIRKDNHVYVLIQVVDLAHAFFRGFAFSHDAFEYSEKQFYQDQPGYRPKNLRTLDELLVLLSNREPMTSDNVESSI